MNKEDMEGENNKIDWLVTETNMLHVESYNEAIENAAKKLEAKGMLGMKEMANELRKLKK